MTAADNLKPFLPKRASGAVFIGLNVLRLLSIITLLLVLSANVVTMANDIKAIKAPLRDDVEELDCDYIDFSTVPDQAGGAFWSILNRLFIIFECILLTLSEIGVPKKLFEDDIPILGPAHGLGGLGVFQALIGAQVLSHYVDLFPQVTSWLLFIIGCFNILAGIFFRAGSKTKRLLFSWENVSSLTPQTRMAATAWDIVSEKRKQRDPSSAPPAELSHHNSRQYQSPLLPENSTAPGARFGGFGFGKQGEKAAAEKGFKISRPLDTLPRYVI